RGAVERLPSVGRRVEIPGRHQVFRRPPEVAVGAALGGIQKLALAAQTIRGRKAVDGPGEAARPCAIGPQPLLRRFAEKAACRRVKDRFVSRAAVGTDEVFLRSLAMLDGDMAERLVARVARRPEDDADIHHDVNKERMWAEKGSEVAAHLASQGERAAG